MRSSPNSPINRVFQALGDPTRRAIIERLGAGPTSASRLAAVLCITVTAVGQHLQILERCGLAASEKIGRVRVCRVNPLGFNLLESWVTHQKSLWERRLDRLADVLDS